MELLIILEIILWLLTVVIALYLTDEIKMYFHYRRRNADGESSVWTACREDIRNTIAGMSVALYAALGAVVWIHWGTPIIFEPFILIWKFLASSKAATGY